MSETPLRQSRDSGCLAHSNRDSSSETLKSLARKVFNRSVSGVSPLESETGRQLDSQPETPLRQPRDSDALSESMRRLESAGICIAIWEDGSMRVLVNESDTLKAIENSATVYSPADLYHYVHLQPRERRLLHQFKRMFGGTTEWEDTL